MLAMKNQPFSIISEMDISPLSKKSNCFHSHYAGNRTFTKGLCWEQERKENQCFFIPTTRANAILQGLKIGDFKEFFFLS